MAGNILDRVIGSFNSSIGNGSSSDATSISSSGQRDHPDMLTRDIGGGFRTNQPYISGYFQVMFAPPQKIFSGAAASAVTWLTSTCEGFTPHSFTVNTVDVIGQGGIGATFPVNKTVTREFTTTHREYQNLPMIKVIRLWASVFDEYAGVSPLKGAEFIPSSYKGQLAVLQTKPTVSRTSTLTADDIEECYIYHGVFPKNVPTDTISSDVTANDTAQLSITWSFDGAPLTSAEPNIVDGVLSRFQEYNYMNTYDKYLNQIFTNKS
jgi:hypothetical protein